MGYLVVIRPKFPQLGVMLQIEKEMETATHAQLQLCDPPTQEDAVSTDRKLLCTHCVGNVSAHTDTET